MDKPKTYPVGRHPNTLKNLKHFGPNNHANDKGRPTKINTLVSLLKDELEKRPKLTDKTGVKNTKTWAQLLAEALPPAAYKALARGDIRPYALILERVEGKSIQPITAEVKIQPIDSLEAKLAAMAANAE